jgi:glycosyltransferase involved in cell wall biosynthesis
VAESRREPERRSYARDGYLATGWTSRSYRLGSRECIPPRTVVDLGALPISAMLRLYREMDVGLFPNRCEGGTNLVAMECMAFGVPVILSRNTGRLDLVAPDRCFPLEQQSRTDGAEHVGWGQSDVGEIVETLEASGANRRAAEAAPRAERNSCTR